MVKICETECLWNGRTKARIHIEGRTQHRNWNLKKRGGRVGLLGQPSDPNRAAMGLSVRQWALCAYGLAPLWFSFFFSVPARMFHKANPARLHSYQKVPQMVLLIILISWKEGKKTIISIIHFSKTVNFNLEDSVCLSFSLHHHQPNNPNLKSSLGQKKGDQARCAHTLNILLTTFSPGEEESSAHRTLLEGSTFL